MLPIDPGDGQGSVTPAPPPVPPPQELAPLPVILPAAAVANGGTIIRPGAVAWGGPRQASGDESASGEAIERALALASADPGQLASLLAELARTRLRVPLPARQRPITDGAAVRLPIVAYDGADFVPGFTSVQRLTAWADASPSHPGDRRSADAGRRWQRAGDARVVPHVVVPAAGLARRLPPGLGLALNPGSSPGLPLYPECVSYLARTALTAAAGPAPAGARPGLGHPPVEPAALLREASAAFAALPQVRAAARAWLSVPGRGEGLIIAVWLDDPVCDQARLAAVAALEQAVTRVPLRVPFPVDATFPGESAPDEIDDWITRNTRPFYARC